MIVFGPISVSVWHPSVFSIIFSKNASCNQRCYQSMASQSQLYFNMKNIVNTLILILWKNSFPKRKLWQKDRERERARESTEGFFGRRVMTGMLSRNSVYLVSGVIYIILLQ